MNRAPVFVLLTDFGLGDPYAGQMKAVLQQGCPGCAIIDLSHEVEAQNVIQGGFFLAASWPYLPRGSVCIGVVDPGVGTSRGLLLLEKQGRYLLVPDNGLASRILDMDGKHTLWTLEGQAGLQPGSATFDGRGLFAPLAVKLMQEGGPGSLWTPLTNGAVQRMDAFTPTIQGSEITASILHIDRFGNCILNLAIRDWDQLISTNSFWELIEPAPCRIQLVHTYQDLPREAVGMLKGSQAMFELAMNQDSCARWLNLKIGSRCVLQPVSGI